MANLKAIPTFRYFLEAKRAPMYHSVFCKGKEEGSTWGHHFDADDKEDARIEKDSIRRDGGKTVSLTVPKSDANWHQKDVHKYVEARLAGKKHDEIDASKKTNESLDEAVSIGSVGHLKQLGLRHERQGGVEHIQYMKRKGGDMHQAWKNATAKLASTKKEIRTHFGAAVTDHIAFTTPSEYKSQDWVWLHSYKGKKDIKESLDEAEKKLGHVALVSQHVYADKIGRTKDGAVVLRKGFFYSGGGTGEEYARGVSQKLTDAGVKHTVVDHGMERKPFRGGAPIERQSHFWAKVKIHESVDEAKGDGTNHRVAVVISDPTHTAVTMRQHQTRRILRVVAPNPAAAEEKATKHYKKQGYKVHDTYHIGTVGTVKESAEQSYGHNVYGFHSAWREQVKERHGDDVTFHQQPDKHTLAKNTRGGIVGDWDHVRKNGIVYKGKS